MDARTWSGTKHEQRASTAIPSSSRFERKSYASLTELADDEECGEFLPECSDGTALNMGNIGTGKVFSYIKTSHLTPFRSASNSFPSSAGSLSGAFQKWKSVSLKDREQCSSESGANGATVSQFGAGQHTLSNRVLHSSGYDQQGTTERVTDGSAVNGVSWGITQFHRTHQGPSKAETLCVSESEKLQQILQEDGVCIINRSGAVLHKDGTGAVLQGEPLWIIVLFPKDALDQMDLQFSDPLAANVKLYTLKGDLLSQNYLPCKTLLQTSLDVEKDCIGPNCCLEVQVPRSLLPLSSAVGNFPFYLQLSFTFALEMSARSSCFKVYSKKPKEDRLPSFSTFQCSSCAKSKERTSAFPSKSNVGCVTCGLGKPVVPAVNEDYFAMEHLPTRIAQEWMEVPPGKTRKENRPLVVKIDVSDTNENFIRKCIKEMPLEKFVRVYIESEQYPNECVHAFYSNSQLIPEETPRIHKAELKAVNLNPDEEGRKTKAKLHLHLKRKSGNYSAQRLPLSKNHRDASFRLVAHLIPTKQTFKSNRFVTTSSAEDVYIKQHLYETADEVKVHRYFLLYHGKKMMMPWDIRNSLVNFRDSEGQSSQQRITDFLFEGLSCG